MKHYFNHIENHIDAFGKVKENQNVSSSLQAAVALGKSLLGCTISVHGKSFIIRMLELYYGGAGDDGHDWHRTHYQYKTSKNRHRTAVQSKEGLAVYLSAENVEDTYTRMDIVAGNEGVAVSFLLRSVWNDSFDRIGTYAGSPNKVLNALGFKPDDHGKLIAIDQPADIYIDTSDREEFIKSKGLTILFRKRINLKSTFEDQHKVWLNMFLEKNVPGTNQYSLTYTRP